MDPLRGILAVALPAVIAGALLLLVRRRWAGALAVSLGAVAGIVALFAPRMFDSPTPLIALVALAGGVAGAVPVGRARVAVLAALAALPPLVALWFLDPDYMPRSTKLAWGAGEAVVTFATLVALDAWAGRRESYGAPVVLWVVAAGGALAVAISVHVSGGQVAGSVAATLGALAVLTFLKPQEGAVRAAMPVVGSVLASTWLVAHHMQDFAIAATAILLGAPLLAWTGELAKKRRELISGAVVLAAVLVAVGLSLNPEHWQALGFKKTEARGE